MLSFVSCHGFANTDIAVGSVLLRIARAPVPLRAEYDTRAADERVVRGPSISASITAEYRASFQMNVKTSDRLYVSAAGPPGRAFAIRCEAPEET